MVGLDYVINLVRGNFMSGMKEAIETTKGLDGAVTKTDKKTRGLKNASQQGFGGMIKWAKRAAVATGLIFGISQAMAFGNEVTNITAKMEGYTNAIEFASGQEGAKNIRFLNDTIKTLNLDMNSSYKGFQTLTGSLKGTQLEGQATRDIFEAVGVAATVMNLSAEQSEGAFLALSQMASKGKVQAEELRGQLGERIPGALNIAARAMGVTQGKLNDMLDAGEVYANEFLPKFAKELKKTFQDGLPAAANSMQAAINTKNTTLLSFKNAFGEYMRPAIIEILKLKSKFFAFMEELLPKLTPIWESFKNIGNALSPLGSMFNQIGGDIGGLDGALQGLKTALDAIAVVVEIFANGIAFLWEHFNPLIKVMGVAIALQWALNAALTANPIGVVVMAITALVGGIIYAYEKVGWFRGAVKATWETIKGFANLIKDMVISRIKQMISGITGIGKTLMLFFKGEWKEAWKAGTEAVKNLTGIGVGNAAKMADGMRNIGKKAGNAYIDGLNEAEANKSKKKDSLFNVTSKTKTANQSVFTDNTKTESAEGNPNSTGKPRANVSGSSGGSSKTITFRIDSLVKQLTIQPQTLKEGAQDIEKQMKDVFLRLIRDVELQHG